MQYMQLLAIISAPALRAVYAALPIARKLQTTSASESASTTLSNQSAWAWSRGMDKVCNPCR